MRRNSVLAMVVTLAITLLSFVEVAEAGGLLSRILSGKNGGGRHLQCLRIFKRVQPRNYCPQPDPCDFPQSIYGQNCPTELLMEVRDVDLSGNYVCVFRVFVVTDCESIQTPPTTFTMTLSCEVEASHCANGMCGTNGVDAIKGPFIEVMPLPPGPGPGPTPPPGPGTGNPGTGDVKITSDLHDGVSSGLPAVVENSTRQVTARKGEKEFAGYFKDETAIGLEKYYELYRLSYNHGNEVKKAGIGFPVDASLLPPNAKIITGKLSNLDNKTNRIDEVDPNNPNQFVWTYVVHDYK